MGNTRSKQETVCGGQVLVAQLAERLIEDQEALGSIPSENTHPLMWGGLALLAQLAEAADLKSAQCGFESHGEHVVRHILSSAVPLFWVVG